MPICIKSLVYGISESASDLSEIGRYDGFVALVDELRFELRKIGEKKSILVFFFFLGFIKHSKKKFPFRE